MIYTQVLAIVGISPGRDDSGEEGANGDRNEGGNGDQLEEIGTAAGDMIDQAGALVATPLFLAIMLGVVGVVLLTSGRRIYRSAAVVCGLIIGVMVGAAVSQAVTPGESPLWWILGGAVGGCILAFLLVRLWMAGSTALMLAVLGPLVHLGWVHDSVPDVFQPEQAAQAQVEAAEGQQADQADEAQPSNANDDRTAMLVERLREAREQTTFFRAWREEVEEKRDHVDEWWDQREDPARRTLLIIAAAGGVLGLLVGLALPHFAAALQSSLVGAMLVVVAYQRLALSVGDGTVLWTPQTGRGVLVLMAAVALAGVVIQQWIWGRKRR